MYVLMGAENPGRNVQFRMKPKLKDLENCIKAIVNLTKTFTSLISWVWTHRKARVRHFFPRPLQVFQHIRFATRVRFPSCVWSNATKKRLTSDHALPNPNLHFFFYSKEKQLKSETTRGTPKSSLDMYIFLYFSPCDGIRRNIEIMHAWCNWNSFSSKVHLSYIYSWDINTVALSRVWLLVAQEFNTIPG